MIQVVPTTINFPPPYDDFQKKPLKITNTTEYLLSFKILTKFPKRYRIPNWIGILKPGETKTIKVNMKLEENGKLEGQDKLQIKAFKITTPSESIPTEDKERNEYCKNSWRTVNKTDIVKLKILATFQPEEGLPVPMSPRESAAPAGEDVPEMAPATPREKPQEEARAVREEPPREVPPATAAQSTPELLPPPSQPRPQTQPPKSTPTFPTSQPPITTFTPTAARPSPSLLTHPYALLGAFFILLLAIILRWT